MGALTLPSTTGSKLARRGIALDAEAVTEAVSMLGIRLPVTIRLNGNMTRVMGQAEHWIWEHVITLSSNLRAEDLSRTLWHELQHCVQAETFRTPADFNVAYTAAMGQGRTAHLRYRANAFEVEAEAAEEWHVACPLTTVDEDLALKARAAHLARRVREAQRERDYWARYGVAR